MNLNIAFDIDGVMADLVSQLKDKLAADGIVMLENDSYEIKTNPQISKTKLWKYIDACYADYHHTPIFAGAEDLCDILHGRSQRPVCFVTTRPDRAAALTHGLVNRFCKVPYQISFAKKQFGKGAYLNGVKYFVEDRRSIAKNLAGLGKIVFMPKTRYNRMPPHGSIIEIDGVADLLFHVDRFIED